MSTKKPAPAKKGVLKTVVVEGVKQLPSKDRNGPPAYEVAYPVATVYSDPDKARAHHEAILSSGRDALLVSGAEEVEDLPPPPTACDSAESLVINP